MEGGEGIDIALQYAVAIVGFGTFLFEENFC